jgi:hypothetical protein
MRLSTTLFAASLAASALAATNCNGNDALCQRLYSNVTYIGTHNSYAVGTNAADNQAKDVTAQLVSVCSRVWREAGGEGRSRTMRSRVLFAERNGRHEFVPPRPVRSQELGTVARQLYFAPQSS